MIIYTVGHSTLAEADFLDLLKAHGIARLVDVRRFPGSRRQPQFSADRLAQTLEQARIEYVHEPDLGGRRSARKDSPNRAWRAAGFRGYADYMATPPFDAALTRLLGHARSATTAVMCAEAVPWRCHRQLIADALVAQGHEVRHITGAARADAHKLNPHARVSATGRVTYPDSTDDQPSLL